MCIATQIKEYYIYSFLLHHVFLYYSINLSLSLLSDSCNKETTTEFVLPVQADIH